MTRTVFTLAAAVMLPVFLAGCATVAVQGASRAKDQATIAANETAAEKGDAAAQMAMGDSHCCSIAGSVGVLNNQKATYWYCRAADQNVPRAQYELGRIYSGDLVRGANAPAKVGAFLTSQRENKPLALMWLTLAAQAGYDDAAEEVADLREDMTPAEIQEAGQRQQSWQTQPCEWNEVYADNQL